MLSLIALLQIFYMEHISLEFLKINHNEKYLYANFLLAKKDIQFLVFTWNIYGVKAHILIVI